MGSRPYSEYAHIELTSEEAEDALNYKRMLKARFIEEEDKKESRRRLIEKHRAAWSCDELMEEVMLRSKQLPFEFEVDEDNENVIKLLCLYFSGDQRFNSEVIKYADGAERKLSLSKGVALISAAKGTGKSVLMRLFQQNKNRPFLLMETKNVSDLFQKKGTEALEIHSELIHVPPTPTFFYYDRIGICFDDLGFELPKNHWGTKSDVMADVLFSIYSKNQAIGDYSNFHFTSNLSGKDFEDRYDDRIRDRMREMFNVIPVSGKSRRK